MNELMNLSIDTFQLSQEEFFTRLIVAVSIGFIIGLEREHLAYNNQKTEFAGIRSFTFISLLGFFTAFLSIAFSPYMSLFGFLGLLLIVGISYYKTVEDNDLGGTTEMVALLVFMLGVLSLLGFITEALISMVVVLVFLSLKVQLLSFVGKITQEELYAFIIFVVLAILIMPFLPDQNYGPYNVINPREIGWIIILTSGLSFIGYILMRVFGSVLGILMTGIIGGLISSTAVTWVFSKRSQTTPSLSLSCAVAILAASTIMVLRVIVWIYVFNPQLISGLLVPLLLIFASGLVISIYYFIRQKNSPKVVVDAPLGKPLNLKAAILFGFIYTLISIIVSYANDVFGESGILISSAIAALTDIDAITISISKLAGTSLSLTVAINAIIIATLCNTVVKIGISMSAGSRQLKKHVAIGYGTMLFIGLTVLIYINV